MSHHFAKSSLSLAIMLSGMASSQIFAEENINGQQVTKLETIVVTASAAAIDIENAPASITVITSEEIQKQPVTSLSELLSKVPGVSGGQGLNGEGAKIKLRGLPSEYSLILVDGKRIGNSSRTAYRTDLQRQDLDWITPDLIERIEVVKGPMSSLYGSDAMGGVINIITKDIPEEWGGSATINYKSPASSKEGATTQLGATVGGALADNIGLRITAGRTKRQADENVISESESTTGVLNETIESSLRWKLNDSHKIELFGSYGEQTNTNPTAAANADLGEFWLGTDGEKDKTESKRYGLTWDGQYYWGGNSSLSIYQNKYDKSTTTESNGIFTPTDQKTTQTVLDGKLTIPFTAYVPHTLTVGGQWRNEELTNSRTLGINSNGAPSVDGVDHSGKTSVEADVWALFLENTAEITDKWNVTVGGRFDKDERFDGHFSPRIYSVYHIIDGLTLKGGISTAFRAPDLVQTAAAFSTGSRGNGCRSAFGAYDAITNPNGFNTSYGTTGFANCYSTGNPDLEPEKSTNYEIGFNFNRDIFDSSLTYFYTDFKDKIVSKAYKHIPNSEIAAAYQSRYPNGVYYVSPVNVENAVTQGLEGSLNVSLTDSITWKNNATYIIESKNKNTGAALINTPELSWYTSLNVNVYEPLDLDFNAHYIGKEYVTDEETAPNAYLKAYWLFGFNANYYINDNLTLRGGISNLLDESLKASDTSSDYYTLEGRTYYVGLTARF